MKKFTLALLLMTTYSYAANPITSCINEPVVLNQINTELVELRDAQIELAQAIEKYNAKVESINTVACSAKKLDKLTVVSQSDVNGFIINQDGNKYVRTGSSSSQKTASESSTDNKPKVTTKSKTEAASPASKGWPRRYTQWIECSGGKTYDFVKVYSSLDDQNKYMRDDWKKVCEKVGEKYLSMTGEGSEYNVEGSTSDPAVITDSAKPSSRHWPKKYEIAITCIKSLADPTSETQKFTDIRSYANSEAQKTTIEDNKSFCKSKGLDFQSGIYTLIK